MARDDPSAESSPASASLSTAPTSLDTVAQTHFKCSVTVRDLERESLSRSHDHVRCFIAHDDAASLNLYIDQREGLDYLYHRLTDNIRHVYAGRGRNVNVQLSSKKRLEIVLQSDDSKQRLFELLSKIEARDTLLAKLSVYAPRASQRAASSHGRGARSFVAQKPKVTYADRSIVDVCSQRTRECIPLKTDKIKRLVTKRTSSSNPLNSQDEDAQVFLEELLNQSRQSIRARAINEYPFVGKFECDIDHRLVCMTCGKERIHTEQNQILSLDLQERTRASKQKAATIQSLLPRFFSPQEISFYCDACEGEKAVAHRTVSRLPKVLVLHLKRFQRDERDHSWTNDEPVTLEDSLLLDQYCNAEALGSALRFDEGLGSGHDQYPTIHYILDSDDEENPTQLPSNTIDLVEDSDEELQYRWAIEDSIRVQSLSQSSVSYEEHEDSTRIGDETLTDSIYEDIKALTSNDLSFMADVRDTASSSKHNPALLKDESFTNHQQRSGTSTPTMAPPKMILPELFAMTNGGNLPTPSALKPTKAEDDAKNSKGNHDRSLFKDEKDDLKKNIDGKDDFQGGNDVDGDDSDSDDEDFKRAIQASLQPCSTTSVSEKEVKEQEDRDLEEAIRRSLLDQEDNKENISPEDFDDQKKAKNEVDGDGGGKQPGKRGDMHSEGTDNSGNSGNRLSFSQPVGKRDLDLHGGGRRSGNDLKRAQLRRCSSIDVSSMMVRTRRRSGNSRSDIQIHQHTTTSSSSSSLQRTPSEYNLRSLESRVSRRDSAESSSLASKGLSTTKVTKPDTATSKKGDGIRPASVAGSTSSLGVLTPPTPTTPPKEKSAGDSRRVTSLSSPSTRRSMTTASRPAITSSGSSSTSTMPNKTTRADNSQQHADQSDPDNVATRPPGDEAERAGLYRLRAVVSKPTSGGGMNGGGSGQQAGYYLCDSLGSDGVWRCFDHQTVRRIGSWANMDQQRARIGYLAIYVHTV
ncbi:Ubiquitin carboxyl-terminal hydrolase 29 [Actinomortierella ambigua]|nr:Ubiquitin carboxyl-terminal hydrolase 29 [Actinomortierella ambigua]